jgi:ribose-phosphate pyrophosphokinase
VTRRPLAIFGLQLSIPLAEQVAAHLGVALAAHEEREFEAGEHKTRALQPVRGQDVFVLHSLYGDDRHSANDKLCRLLFFCGALKDAGAARVTAVTPYLCYGRKDRRTKPQDPVTTRYVAALFEAMRVDRMIALEVHDLAAFENAFRCETVHIASAPLLAAHFAARLHDETALVVVAPDAGGAKRADQVRQALQHLTGRDIAGAYMEKFRSNGELRGTLLAGEVRGKTAVIIDDMISSGATLLRAAAACHAAGAARIFAAAAHGLFMDGAPALFASPLLAGIAVTDTVPPFRVPAAAGERLTVLDTSAAIARAIADCHEADCGDA